MKLLAVVLILLAGAGGFFTGIIVGKQKAENSKVTKIDSSQNGNVFTAEVESIENNLVTVKLPDGTSKIVIVPVSTPIRSSKTVGLSDIQKGQVLLIAGFPNQESNVEARSIQIFENGIPKSGPAPGVPSSEN